MKKFEDLEYDEQRQDIGQLDEIMTISYNGEIYNIIDEDIINRIMEIIMYYMALTLLWA